MDSTPLQLFKEISQMSKEFRYCILHSMPKEYRFDIGGEILRLMRSIKHTVYLSAKRASLDCDSRDTIIDMLIDLKIDIDECIEDKLLSVKGEYTIVPPRKRLMEILQKLGATVDTEQ